MRFPWILATLTAVATVSLAACSDTALPESVGGGGAGLPDPDATLAFEDEGTLTLYPREVRSVTVVAKPAASYEITFALLGDALDASLDRAVVVASSGRATVELRAPNSSITFRLRASIKDGASAELGVAVSDKGFGGVRAVPVYAGQRNVTQWTASVLARTTCAEIAASLPADPAGALLATAPAGSAPLVSGAPVGPNLAVAVRAGKFAWGCADEPGLVAGAVRDVKVNVVDKPIDLSTAQLDVSLDFAPAPEPWGELLASGAELLAAALLPGDPGVALLDAMLAQSTADKAATLADARVALGWDDIVTEHFGALASRPEEQLLGRALEGLSLEPPALHGLLSPSEGVPGKALLSDVWLGDVDAVSAGIPPAHLLSWTADASDTVFLGGPVFFSPSRYAASAAHGAAVLGGSSSLAHELAEAAGCAELGVVLGGVEGCDDVCLKELCESALVHRLKVALGASGQAGMLGKLSINASGAAKVDDVARPTSFSGSWLGSATAGASSASLKGAVVGTLHEAKPPP